MRHQIGVRFCWSAATESYDESSGYRGGPGSLEHRGLPAVDARLIVNLVWQPRPEVLLDPFAGAGGIVTQARSAGWSTISVDRDRTLRFGLHELSTHHVVADAGRLPLADASVDAIATEPPYHQSATKIVEAAIAESVRVLRAGGRGAMMVAAAQAAALRATLAHAGLDVDVDSPVDRKGTAVHCFAWTR